ncbi:RND family transporter [Pseudomonas aeruginosa]|uniref:efflux RND transporter permease subunit n=1 Tax=Pseudomonas aeruginosa TaxID=287 RepID=UPI001F5B95B2|nr:RND family transporter [Pseudomonas aeruginosa]UGR48897.2 RND family transporter [Pseudomonas aeruginosa]
MLSYVEGVLFRHRRLVLASLAVFTLIMGWFAVQLRMDAGFEKQLPVGHEYIETFEAYRNDLLGANRLTIVVKAREGDIWSAPGLKRLYDVTQAVTFLPGVSRSSVRSLWTPNAFVNEITEEGFRADPLVPGTVSPEHLDDRIIAKIANSTAQGGFIGTLVSRDQSSAMITVELNEYDSQDAHLDYVTFNHRLEKEIRQRFEDGDFEIQIIGFAKQIGDIADGASAVLEFCLLALLITLVLLYWFTKCIRSTIAVLITTLVAVLWQLGLLNLVGFGLDPYSMLVPFLIFAIGISHGVQKINGIALQSSGADNALMAARLTFRQLFLPGMIAILADAVGFITLLVIDIGVIRELAIGASIGVAVIVFTNLILLPVAISYIGISKKAVQRSKDDAVREHPFWRLLSNFASPKVAPVSIAIALLMLGGGLWYGKHLKIGDLDQGAPELRPDSRYNLDNDFIIRNYSTSSDVLVVMVKTSPEGCSTHQALAAMDELAWKLENTEGVQSAISMVTVSKQVIKGMNEGNLKWETLSRNQDVLNNSIARADGLYNTDCSLAPLLVFLNDHKAETLDRAVAAVQAFAAENDKDDLQFQLAAGNAGIEAATNEVIKQSELIILVLVYICVAAMCMITFRSFAATLCIVLPLILTSVLGNALMAALGIGVKVATLPVIALGVGIGVDYGIYIYTRLESFLRMGLPLQEAYYETLRSTGKAVLFTGLCLAIGVATWIFSAIKFQADMGKLLAFMFVVNMVMAMTVLPAFAVWLERAFPRKRPVRMIGALVH